MSEEKKVEERRRREDEEIEGDGVSERWGGGGWEGGVRRERGEGAVTGEDVPKRSMLISGGGGCREVVREIR